MAALLGLLLLLAVSPVAVTTNVYYVTTDHKQLCPLDQICHNLSYYTSDPESYFISNTTFIFLVGKHSFDRDDCIHVSKVHNLTLRGQGQWPIPGDEENVMQSTVTINCIRGKGGFSFAYSYNISVEGLTIVNCGRLDYNAAAFSFHFVQRLFFQKNSIQNMTGYGLFILNCDKVLITNCSYYHSSLCDITHNFPLHQYGGGVGIIYDGSTRYGNTSYTLELSYSNITKCCSYGDGGGLNLETLSAFGSIEVVLNNLVLSQNKAFGVGGFEADLLGDGYATLVISNCVIANGTGHSTGGMALSVAVLSIITIENTVLVENVGPDVAEIYVYCTIPAHVLVYLLNTTIVHTKMHSNHGVWINGCSLVKLLNTSMKLVNLRVVGFYQVGSILSTAQLQMDNCWFVNCRAPLILHFHLSSVNITNCTFSNNTGDRSVIFISQAVHVENTFTNSFILDNSMTGITIFSTVVRFVGRNVIQNNSNTNGAGITLSLPASIEVAGELYLYNNTAHKRGGAFFAINSSHFLFEPENSCSLVFVGNSSLVVFSGNRARLAGSDTYGAVLMGCANGPTHVPRIGQPNETSWYFDTPLMKHIRIRNTDRLSSMSSDPIMVCFCNSSNLPDCSDRTHHIQSYPGLEINTSIATVGYYGGTSPGVVQVTAQHATLVRYHTQNKTNSCFPLNILLHSTTSATALVDIRVNGGLHGWGVSIGVNIADCPIGTQNKNSKHCHCEQYLTNNNIQCVAGFQFQRMGNSWFAYINNTQCITGTTNCPFDYCNRSNVTFDIIEPDRQCLGNRTGILCGECQSHLSILLGSNRCGTCSNWYLLLLPVFALTGIVLVVVLMLFNLSVSVGSFNGLLFYANMVKLNEAFFFPNGSIPVVSQFISWLNLDLGIEVCLFDGLDGYWNTWLQFAFPAYLFFLMGCIIVGCRCSVRFCQLFGSHAVPTLATLVFIPYTKILLTVSDSLSMSQLPCNNSILTVWSVDGNIEYGSHRHLVLVVFSCGVLVIGLAYPVLVLCAPLLERYSDKCIPFKWNPVTKFKPLLDAYGGPYKDRYRFWTGMTLLVRLIVTVTFFFTSSSIVNVYITAIVVGIILLWSSADCVYKSIYLSTLEAFHLLNIIILSIVCLFASSLKSKNYQIAAIVSVCLSFAVFLITMALHVRSNFDLKNIKRKLGFRDRQSYAALSQEANDDDKVDQPLGSPSSIVYGSNRGKHQFVLEFPSPRGKDLGPSSPVLLAREPLLFDT